MQPSAELSQVSEHRHVWRLPRVQELGLLVVVLALGATLSLYGWYDAEPGAPNTFLNFDNLVTIIATRMSYYAIMAVGVTLVIIAGGIDISVAAIMTLAAMIAAWTIQDFGREAPAIKVLPVVLTVALLVGLACGLLNGLLVVGLRMHPFIVTLGTMSIFSGVANVLPFGAKTLPLSGHPLPRSFTANFMKLEVRDVQPMPMIITLIIVVLGWFYLRLMVAGRETYAVGGNEEAARFSGLRVNLIKLRVYVLCGLAAGMAGMVCLGRFGSFSTNSAAGYELTVIAAAVVGGASLSGGRGSALGALLGALILTMIENGITILHLNQEYKNIIIGGAIIVAVAMDRLSEYVRSRRLAGTHSS